jgi:FkbM family methyltransferase
MCSPECHAGGRNLPTGSTFHEARGAIDRWRRALRRRVLEPVLVGHRSFRETVLNALAARGHLVYCRTADATFFVDPSDRVVANELMWRGDWQREELEFAVRALADAGRLPAGAVFVDVGANIGTQTVYAMKTGRFARAIAIEPEPRNAELLAMNLKANDLADAVTLVEAAAGDRAGSATLYLHPRNKAHHTVGTPPSIDGLDRVEVPMVRLDAVLRQHGVAPDRIGMVWIDVEGLEPQVIDGLGDVFGKAPLVIEFAPGRYGDERRRALCGLIERHYERFYRLGRSGGAPEPTAAIAKIATMTDILVF